MTPQDKTSQPEFFEWLEALCEDRLTPEDARRLEQLVLRDAAARRTYLAYLDLHGTLYWNAAYDGDVAGNVAAQASQTTISSPAGSAEPISKRQTLFGWRVAAAVVVAIAVLSFLTGRWFTPSDRTQLTNTERSEPADPNRDDPVVRHEQPRIVQHEKVTPSNPASERMFVNQPVKIAGGNTMSAESAPNKNVATSVPTAQHDTPQNSKDDIRSNDGRTTTAAVASKSASNNVSSGSVQTVVTVINEHLAAGWKLYGVEPSPAADDAEWLRRVYLDVVGHIPPVDVAERFLAGRDPQKRERLVDSLLDDPAYVRNWSAVWTNLLVGRSDSRDINRSALKKFLRESFARNRPWNEMVAEFISAEGNVEENGATNFLLAHLNNSAMPATAITSRVFLGRQIACTQCHDHPFNDWKQESFWAFNSFFQQTAVVRSEHRDARTGIMRPQVSGLETKAVGGETTFETRRGLMQATVPRFEGVAVSTDANTNRRHELAKLMTSGDKPLIAEALVNRMWDHFFGCGFTRPVDDMGPHSPVSHPELLEHLSREFVASGYDTKQLIRWICLSDAYQRTSRFGKSNEQDDPASGTSPLFSRVYIKAMTAEQLYDSLLLATGADKTPLESGDHERRRHEWLQQFVHAFQTDENDESVTFESSITQALLMMNSELTQHALSLDRGTFLEKLIHDRDAETEKIKRLCLATLTRFPSPKEQQAIRKLVHEGAIASARSAAGWQDALWAYLNSSEFILVH